MMKRMGKLLICVLLAAAMTTGVLAADPSAMQDIRDHWARDAIYYAMVEGLFSGVSETEFAPDLPMSRAMYVTVLGRLAGINQEDYRTWYLEDLYPDVDSGQWYAPYVCWATRYGITNGVEGGLFAPDASITREQMATMTVRFASIYNYEITASGEPTAWAFTDWASISDFAWDAVESLRLTGIMNGALQPDGSYAFGPKELASRAQCATIMSRLSRALRPYEGRVPVEPASIILAASTSELQVGDYTNLTASVAPANATNKSVSWATTVGGVVSVSESGLVTAVAAGTTIVSCTANDGSGATAACEVTVMPNDKYPVPYFVSVTCKNEKPLELTNDDVLRMEAVFGNRGIAGNVVTLPVVLTNDGSLMIVEEGEELSRMFPAGENTTVGHSLSLANVPEGDYYATVLLYKESDDEEETGWYYSSRCLVDIHVSAGSLKGDVNGDGEVNGTDLVVLANIILDRSENRPAADVNGDGEVNGTDLVVLVNIVLERDASRMAADISTGHFSTSTTLQLNSLDIAAGETKELTVSLQNPGDALTLLQFDLTLPEGLSIQKIAGDYQADMAGRTSSNSHQLSVQAGGTSLRFLLASPVNALIAGTEGAVVRMAVTASHGFAGGTISLHNILGVSPDEQEVRMSAVQYDMADSTTGIYSMTDRQIVPTVYNLHGQRMAKLKSGINIMDGKKLFKK